MNVLSLFDGISCARIALDRANISYDHYYASEIDKYATKIALKNYPDTVELGDINNWKEWKLPRIDLLIGGSPCQGFSVAGKGLNFDDPRSKLFFEFVDILHEYVPKYFLLENVKMKKEWRDIITQYMGVEPILINSALVSAQNRERLYWTNIPNIKSPEDRNIMIGDILENDVEPVIIHNIYGGFKEKELRVFTDKSPTIRTASGGGHIPSVIKKGNIYWKDVYEEDADNVFYYTKDSFNWLLSDKKRKNKFKLYFPDDEVKMQMLEASHYKGYSNERCFGIVDKRGIRYISPIECERLQTVPDNYTEGVSNTQRYKMLGNAFTVDVIAELLSPIRSFENGG